LYLQPAWQSHTTALPFALRPENFDSIRRNLDNLEWHHGSIEEYLAAHPDVRIDRVTLSDIFEYMSPENYRRLLERLLAASRPEAVQAALSGNPELEAARAAVEKARKQSVTRDVIERAIKKASQAGNNLEELIFEAYGPGGIAILVYVIFYLVIFGVDEVKWMVISSGLGIIGIASQIDWILSLFVKHVSDYPWYVHVVPFTYFILYTFLLRHAVLDLLGVQDDDEQRPRVEYAYVGISLAVYLTAHLLGV